jgi:hypothetical protein
MPLAIPEISQGELEELLSRNVPAPKPAELPGRVTQDDLDLLFGSEP